MHMKFRYHAHLLIDLEVQEKAQHTDQLTKAKPLLQPSFKRQEVVSTDSTYNEEGKRFP